MHWIKRILLEINNKPALLLLLAIYLVFLPILLSCDNAWMHPEEFSHKGYILSTQPCPEIFEFKGALNWRVFEYLPRPTRPLSSLFEVIDTFFRSWLWKFIQPHPSLSLIWILTLVLSPLLLYRVLRRQWIDANTALVACCLYLMNPVVLSWNVMLFRPAKPVVDFCMILVLFLCSRYEPLLNRKSSTIKNDWIIILVLLAASFFDETGLLILPIAIYFYPQILAQKRWIPLALLPFLVLWSYWQGLPWLTNLFGYPYPHFSNYEKIPLLNVHSFWDSLRILPGTVKALFLDMLGIAPYDAGAPREFLLLRILALMAMGSIVIKAIHKKAFKGHGKDIALLAGLLLIHNFLMFINAKVVWGAYYYGTFLEIFFIILLAKVLFAAKLNRYLLVGVFFIISANLAVSFIGMNRAYKKCHFYPFYPLEIANISEGASYRFNPAQKDFFSEKARKSFISDYWRASISGQKQDKAWILPKELLWLPIEKGEQNIVCDSPIPIYDSFVTSFAFIQSSNKSPVPASFLPLTVNDSKILSQFLRILKRPLIRLPSNFQDQDRLN